MKLTISPKKFFTKITKSKSSSSSSSVTRSDARSLSGSSVESSSSSSHGGGGKRSVLSTPTSVLPHHDPWSDSTYLELEEAFKIIDKNNDGKITPSELKDLFHWISGPKDSAPTDTEIIEMLREIDADGDGCISFEEFRSIGSAFGPALDSAELRETFEVFDEDHDGRISAEELHKVFVAIGDEKCSLEDCRDMIATVDVNGDGFVCFEDFKLMMEHQTSC